MSLVDDASRRETAAQLGVLIFISSEGLLFAGLFALYTAYRIHYPAAFALGVRTDLRWLGSVNTGLMLASSACMATAVAQLAKGRARTAQGLMCATIILGVGFLGLKTGEYASHIRQGIIPGGHSAWFNAHPAPGLIIFFGLYYLMTALHALHMLVGISWVAVLIPGAHLGRCAVARVERGALYWHFVDVLWVFLWPLFYLLGGRA